MPAAKNRLSRPQLIAEVRAHALDGYTDEELNAMIGPHVAKVTSALAKLSVKVTPAPPQ